MKGEQTKVSGSKRKGRLHRVCFRNPKRSTSMEMLANRLISLNKIQEVYVEDHPEGYMARVRFAYDIKPTKVAGYLSAYLNSDFGEIKKV